MERFYDPVEGELRWFDGTPLRQLDPRWLRQQIGLVSQEPTLFAGSIADNIRYGDQSASSEQVMQAARDANALEFIEALPDGLETQLNSSGGGLSVS